MLIRCHGLVQAVRRAESPSAKFYLVFETFFHSHYIRIERGEKKKKFCGGVTGAWLTIKVRT